ncbi:MAG: SpoIIE family protein phosphatase [Actinomycetota bacterium]
MSRPSQQQSHEESLGALTAGLARAATDEEFAQLADAAIRQVVPDAQVIVRAEGADGRLHALGEWGTRLPPIDPRVADAFPGTDTLTAGRPRWDVPEAAWEAAMDRWWERAGMPPVRSGAIGTGNLLPLTTGRAPIGALIVVMRDGRSLEEWERLFLLAVAGQLAQALFRVRSLERERTARLVAERARMRLAFLSEMTTTLVPLSREALADPWTFLRRFAGMAVPRLADACFVRTYDAEGGMRLVVAVGPDEVVDRLLPLVETPLREASREALLRGEAVVYPRLDVDRIRAIDPDILGRTGGALEDMSALAHLPVVDERGTVGVVSLVCSRRVSDRAFDPDEDVPFFRELASRFGMLLRSAEDVGRGRRIVETFQQAMLPEVLPEVPGVESAARYLPASDEFGVGGDWYELVELDAGRLVAAVGDVVGTGVEAAARMGEYRYAMRALTIEGLGTARLLERLSELGVGSPNGFATTFALILDPATRTVRYSSAGHPPCLVARADGTTVLLEDATSMPLGVESGIAYPEAVFALEPGDTVVLFTDGLVERRDESIDEGLARLRTVAAEAARGSDDVEAFVETLVERLVPEGERDDDVAVLAIRYLSRPLRFELSLPPVPASVGAFRSAFADWLDGAGVGEGDARDLTLAVSEACSNAVEHGGLPGAEVVLVAEIWGEEAVVSVRDGGRWRPPSLRPDRGRGLQILRSVTDAIDVRRRPGGTEVRMRRRLAERR